MSIPQRSLLFHPASFGGPVQAASCSAAMRIQGPLAPCRLDGSLMWSTCSAAPCCGAVRQEHHYTVRPYPGQDGYCRNRRCLASRSAVAHDAGQRTLAPKATRTLNTSNHMSSWRADRCLSKPRHMPSIGRAGCSSCGLADMQGPESCEARWLHPCRYFPHQRHARRHSAVRRRS